MLKEMYSGIIPILDYDGFPSPLGQQFLNNMINDPLNLREFEFHRTRFELLNIADGYPKAWRTSRGKICAVQLRPISHNKLIIGCGNNPTSICDHHPCIDRNKFVSKCTEFFTKNPTWGNDIIAQKDYEISLGENHLHVGYNTIDPNIAMNPTIVSFFGWYPMPENLIRSNSMGEILQEGVDISDLPYYKSDWERITGDIYQYNDLI